MFGIEFSELLLIGIVALVVIGPERLPRVARTAGLLFGRVQRYVSEVKADVNREIHAEELKKLQQEMHDAVNSIEQSVAQDLRQGSEALQAVAAQVHEIVEVPSQTEMAASEPKVPPIAEAAQPQLELGLEKTDSPSKPDTQAITSNKNT